MKLSKLAIAALSLGTTFVGQAAPTNATLPVALPIAIPSLPALPVTLPALPVALPALALPALPALGGGLPALPVALPALGGGLPALPALTIPAYQFGGTMNVPALPLPVPAGTIPAKVGLTVSGSGLAAPKITLVGSPVAIPALPGLPL